ncbi:MAG TPA: beta-ketoacyl synthase N-terminal-like domain-containing protein [Terriglobales bacterium]|nr:beta-ketoacyl synthase N-terminal-like domain-containing protein [Terriglobales bacterium]
MSAVVRAVGLVTGWGRGAEGWPRASTDGRAVVSLTPAPRAHDRLRRATRECLLGVEAVEAMLEDGGVAPSELAGEGTALVYVTAAAYGASNRAFVEGGGGALHFPYTAPSAVPAEVAIELGICGPYAVLIGGPTATIDALAHASALLARGACVRALVLAVETFAECEALHARGGTLAVRPLVEAAAAVLLEVGVYVGARSEGDAPEVDAGTVACAPLIAIARAVAAGAPAVTVRGRWRDREASLTLGVAERVRGR